MDARNIVAYIATISGGEQPATNQEHLMSDIILHRSALFSGLNDLGEGYSVGDDDDVSVNDLADVVGGTLVHRAEHDGDVAVYSHPAGAYILVGDANGPCAVDIDFDLSAAAVEADAHGDNLAAAMLVEAKLDALE